MARTKNAILRQRVIDRCLSSEHLYSTQDIMDRCNEELRKEKENEVTSLNTIRSDISYIEANYPDADIETIISGRNRYYRYKTPGYSIFKTPLNDSQLEKLVQVIHILHQFDNSSNFSWINDFIEQSSLGLGISMPDEYVVDFDENPYLTGREHFSPLFRAINEKKVLKISYKSFKNTEAIQFTIHPYFLKEHNRRWFLFGLSVKDGFDDKLFTLALDRIEKVEEAKGVEYIQNTEYDFIDYFDDMIGVTKPENRESESIRLWISPSRWPYIRTKPIHSTQTIEKEDPLEGTVIKLDVIPNPELEELILSFGEDMKVLEPSSLKERIIEKLKKNLEQYN